MIFRLPEGQQVYQAVAELLASAKTPYTVYAPDREMGRNVAATLAVNFQVGVNPLTLHNPWAIPEWPGGYPLRIPEEQFLETFPMGGTPRQVLHNIGYPPIGDAPVPLPEEPLPAWVQAYFNWLQNQIDRYGHVKRYQVKPDYLA